MSALVFSRSAPREGWGRAPVRFAAAARAFASVSETSTSSARSACFSIAAKWFAAMRPQPTNAKRTFRSRIGGAKWRIPASSGLDDILLRLQELAARIDDEARVGLDHRVVETVVVGREHHAV